jgi:predicted ABC-type ATPase
MTNRRPTLCVVAGPNGSGKTTTTIQLLNNEWAADSLYINPDNIAQGHKRLFNATKGQLFPSQTKKTEADFRV